MDEKIQARLILEVLGRPPEHVVEALSLLVAKLGSEHGVQLVEKEMHEPVLAKDAKDLYTAFVDITLAFDTLEAYFNIIFTYMPAHTELIYPERITFTNEALNSIANRLVQRLHNYDAVAKGALAERSIIVQKLREKAPKILKELNEYLGRASPEPKQKKPGKSANPKKRK